MSSSVKAVSVFGGILALVSVLYFVAVFTPGRPRVDALPEPAPLVAQRATGELPLDPSADFWQGIEGVTVHLLPQTARPPYGTDERDVVVRIAFNDRSIAFRLDFSDATETRGDTPHPDACAVMLAPATLPAASEMMGHGGAANIWQWRASVEEDSKDPARIPTEAARELVASGPGTQGLAGSQNVVASGRYESGRWQVVLRRPLRAGQEGELDLTGATPMNVALAVWDGALGEHLSRKSISVLRLLRMSER